MMEREIKFRAWSPKWKKMLFDGRDGYTIDVLAHTAWRDTADDECIQLMQFTGLKDKNGKEIYEGDLFNCIYFRDGCTNHKFKVVYYAPGTAFLLERIGGECQQKSVVQSISDVARYAVIGNIYESPSEGL